MKRICSIVLIMMLIFTSSAFAEEFTLHSGVIFGMSKEDVASLEQGAGFECEKIEAEETTANPSAVIQVKGKIASIENSSIYYAFDADNKLFSASYVLGSTVNNDDSDKEYEIIEKALCEKYGEPENIWLPVAYEAGFEPLDYIVAKWGLILNNKLPPNSSWAIKQDNGKYVVIVHYVLTFNLSGYTIKEHTVGYQLYDAEVIESAINSITDKATENEEQRNNDL